jgi:hypothetical protein
VAFRGGAIDKWNKTAHAFVDANVFECPDCGVDLPLDDTDAKLAHRAVCPGKRVDGNALTSVEADELAAREQVIERGFKVWQEVGEALLHIRDKRLYRATHKTFEDYCRERWQMSRSRAHRLIDASEVASNLLPIGNIPANESQARELTTLEPEAQRLGWQIVEDTAPDGKITAAHVKSVVAVLKEVFATGALDDGTGEQIPVAAATPEHLKAAITEETYERLKRQETYIAEKQAAKSGGVPPALTSSESNEYYTPAKYLDAVRTLLGGIDVDPASNPEANRVVQAAQFYSQADNGLAHEWRGRVFLNPPYGYDAGDMSNQERWSARLIEQYEAGSVTEAILLVNAVTDRQWFQPLWKYPMCFTDHRIRFYRPGGEPGTPVIGSVFVYFGANHMEFARVFRQFGAVVLAAIQGNDDDAK